MKLNLGCGRQYWDGYKNIDISPDVRTDECYDLSERINEEDDSVDEIHSGCMLEQVKDFSFLMNECHRVLKKGGLLHGYVPSTDPRVLHLDPMDKHFFQLDSFRYFVGHEHSWQEFGKNYGFRPWSEYQGHINDNGILHFKLYK